MVILQDSAMQIICNILTIICFSKKVFMFYMLSKFMLKVGCLMFQTAYLIYHKVILLR